MATKTILVTLAAGEDRREAIESALPGGVEVRYLEDVAADRRESALASADALLSWRPHDELTAEEFDALHEGQFVQLLAAGIDYVPLDRFPDGVSWLNNAGATAEPIAEHVLALYLALSKRLRIEHENMRAGEFNQFEVNHRVAGSTCGIFGFGSIGQAVARILKPLGVEILAVNRSGEAGEEVAFLGTPEDLEYVAQNADALVLTAPLTPETRGVVDREVLRSLPDDGMVINVARGELVDQDDLYAHLQANPAFQAGIDAWWTEPARHGTFEIDHPFLERPNVVGSPHNAAQVPGIMPELVRRAVANVAAAVTTGEHENVVDPELGY